MVGYTHRPRTHVAGDRHTVPVAEHGPRPSRTGGKHVLTYVAVSELTSLGMQEPPPLHTAWASGPQFAPYAAAAMGAQWWVSSQYNACTKLPGAHGGPESPSPQGCPTVAIGLQCKVESQ
jgi:hypothetical protein